MQLSKIQMNCSSGLGHKAITKNGSIPQVIATSLYYTLMQKMKINHNKTIY